MKKIVGILAAAAIATSVFAADVSAATKIGGKLFHYDADKTIGLLTENNDSHDYAQPNITFSVSDEKAGATVKLTTDGGTKEVKMTTQTIWFKPVDMLKITAGTFDIALNKETIDYTESVTGLGGNGFLATVDVSGFTLDVGFEANGKDWLSKKDGADDPTINKFFIKGAYSADFGNIGAYVKFNGAEDKLTKAYKAIEDAEDDEALEKAMKGLVDVLGKPYATLLQPKEGAISSVEFGAGYKNTIDPITFFVNFVGFMDDKFEWVRPEVFVTGNMDAFGFSAFVAPAIMLDSDVKDALDFFDISPIFLETVAKVTYQMDACSLYAYFKDVNLLAKDFAATIKLGANGSLGAMGWNIWAQIDAAEKVGFSVPFELTFSF
jgi:hypothetical protein